jgi:hypothetical protein
MTPDWAFDVTTALLKEAWRTDHTLIFPSCASSKGHRHWQKKKKKNSWELPHNAKNALRSIQKKKQRCVRVFQGN